MISYFLSLPLPERQRRIKSLSGPQLAILGQVWRLQARPNQLPPPPPWQVWLIKAGRGFGKTRCGAEWVRARAPLCDLTNLVGATADDARDIMIEGESGILAICPPHERPEYLASKRQLRWPTGARSLIFTADEPDRLRGKQHTGLWCDELAAWRYQEAWDQAMLGLRLGSNPQAVVTTTPRPSKLIKALMDAPGTVTTSGTTYENRDNLAPAFFERIITKYEGTRMGRQELNAELLDDCPGAMWKLASIDDSRVKAAPALSRVVVAVDPAVTSNDKSDETGIVVCAKGADGHGYVLEDGSGKFTPLEWATRAVALYDKWGADRVVAEVNNGGDLVEANLRQVRKAVPFTAVRASRGKVIRAEPVSALYEQGRCHHVGNHPGLEDQMTTWDGTTGEKSPDRVDALVWGMTDLIVAGIDPGALWA